jgi:hypothetical protein
MKNQNQPVILKKNYVLLIWRTHSFQFSKLDYKAALSQKVSYWNRDRSIAQIE